MKPCAITRIEQCCTYEIARIPCASLKQPKTLEFCSKQTFNIGFLATDKEVHSVEEALCILRMIPWANIPPDTIENILKTVRGWSFPAPHRYSKIYEPAFRFGLQHFYRYLCICEDNKLLYDETYFDDLYDYLGESGYLSGQVGQLSSEMICETLAFIRDHDSSIDATCSANKKEAEQERTKMKEFRERDFVTLFKMKSFIDDDSVAGSDPADPVVTTNPAEAKNVIVSFISCLLSSESQVNHSVLDFFSKQWLSEIYKGCYQFTSVEAFCMFFNNVSVYQFSDRVMFYMPDPREKFTRRLVIRETCLSGTGDPADCAPEDPDCPKCDMIRLISGVDIVENGSNLEVEALASKKLNRKPSMAIRMCPTGDAIMSIRGNLKTISEILCKNKEQSDGAYWSDGATVSDDDSASTDVDDIRLSCRVKKRAAKRRKRGKLI